MARELTDEQWAVLAPLLPPPARTGRPRADDRRTLNGILVVLTTGCRWEDLPAQYGSPVTCWRRLRTWQGDGTWERLWRALLTMLDKRQRVDLEHTALDSSTVAAKKGARRLVTPGGTG
jgi:transposase